MKFKFSLKKIQAKNIETQMTAKIQKEVLEIENLKQERVRDDLRRTSNGE